MSNPVRWGLVATIKAPANEILEFAAHHLELGAHRLYLYLDAPCPDAFDVLKAHPKIRVQTCDKAYWKRLNIRRPVKHQVRQSVNATHAYGKRAEVDWLAHIDVDEFLWPDVTVHAALAAVPHNILSARMRPAEALAGDNTAFKKFIPNGPDRAAIVDRLYPRFGRFLKGGFVSHVAGKLFVRTGLAGVEFRIHNMFLDSDMNPDTTDLPAVELCHCHARPFNEWLRTYRYRHAKGSYRADLAPAVPHDRGGMTLHELFAELERQAGDQGLKRFFDEVCADTAGLRARLAAEGLLALRDLDLTAKTRKHFPETGRIVAHSGTIRR